MEPLRQSPPALAPEGIRPARSMAAFRQSTLREIMARAQGADLISFAVGTPATDLIPSAEIAEAAARVLADGGARPLQYGLPSSALKAHVVELMAERGVACRAEQVFLTSGAQQAMDLAARLLLDPGGAVVLEEAIYDGIRMAVAIREPRVVTVPSDPGGGPDLVALEARLATGPRPALLYVIPEGHNPLGSSLAAADRERLIEIARRHRLPILEDDVYGLLRFEGSAAPPLRALDDRWVLYLGSFSKILSPALRVGWMIAPEELVPALSALKHAADVDTSTLGQHVAARFLAEGRLGAHLDRLRAEYRRRRDAMLAALERSFPAGARWTRPSAGIFVWVELPRGADTTRLLEAALEAGVAFSPGEAFAAGDPEPLRRGLRLSYADNPPERIAEGIARLARVVGERR